MNMTAPLTPRRAQKVLAAEVEKRPFESRQRTLGDTLVRIGRLEPAQIDQVMAHQARTGMPFGRAAVTLGLLSAQDLQYALGVQLGFLHETREPTVIPKRLVVLRNPYCKEAEEFSQMRTRLMTGAAREKLNLLSIAGADAQCDGAYVAANLAASFAQLGRRVLLVDADLRRPKLAKLFGEPTAPGVTDLVIGASTYESALHSTLVKRLDLLPAGAPTRDPQSILGAEAFSETLKRAQKNYDIVIVLATPFGRVADVEYVWAATQKTITLVRQDHTRAETITRMRSVIRGVGAEIIGAAMAA